MMREVITILRTSEDDNDGYVIIPGDYIRQGVSQFSFDVETTTVTASTMPGVRRLSLLPEGCDSSRAGFFAMLAWIDDSPAGTDYELYKKEGVNGDYGASTKKFHAKSSRSSAGSHPASLDPLWCGLKSSVPRAA